MLLQEQMKQDIFSYNERIIVDFILEKQEKINKYGLQNYKKYMENESKSDLYIRFKKQGGT